MDHFVKPVPVRESWPFAGKKAADIAHGRV